MILADQPRPHGRKRWTGVVGCAIQHGVRSRPQIKKAHRSYSLYAEYAAHASKSGQHICYSIALFYAYVAILRYYRVDNRGVL